MDFYVIALRIIHILSGAFWYGTAFAFTQFVSPAATLAGPEGAKFVQKLVLGTQFVRATATAAGLTVLTGLLLYWRASGGLQTEWMSTGTGVMFTIGGIAGIIALFTGLTIGANSRKLATLGASLQGPPSPEQAAEIEGMQSRLETLGAVTSILLLVVLIAMATAQYVFF
jgi:uncharacterized membrane protein